jgi:hypothetical protein
VLIWVPVGVDFGTAESEACIAVLIWVPIGVDVGTAESGACCGVDMGTNWCWRRDS